MPKKEYVSIEFTSGLKGKAYLVVEDGNVLSFVDADGKTLDVPVICEYHVVAAELDKIDEDCCAKGYCCPDFAEEGG